MVTMHDVAAAAGVSQATVSNYLNKPHMLTDRTKARVQSAIDQTGYLHNATARQLRTGNSRLLAFLALELDNTYVSSVIGGLERRAASHGLFLSIACAYGDIGRQSRYIRMLVEQRVYGILIAASVSRPSDLDLIVAAGIPTVLVDQPPTPQPLASCSVDDRLGGRMAADHLISRGARRICFVGADSTVHQVGERIAGARDAIEQHPEVGFELIATRERTIVSGLHLGAALARRPAADRPDAVFAANDSLAAGVLDSLKRAGVRVPQEIAVIGYDDSPLAGSEAFALSTIHRPGQELGGLGLDLLRERAGSSPAVPPRRVEITPSLVVRDTT